MDNIPDELICPITLEIMKEPVLCEDGYTYERSAIMAIQNSISPITRQPIDKSKLILNRALKNAIDRFLSSNTQFQSIPLGKEKLDEELCRLREERIQQEKREKERRIKYEVDKRTERLRLEQQKIKNEHEKGMLLITKYNEKNPRFEYGVRHQHGDSNGNRYFHFIKPTGTSINKIAPDKHKFIFDINLIDFIKNDKTFFINYKQLVKEYEWIDKYINGEIPFIEFVFDEIIPNIDTIIDEISKNLKQVDDLFKQNTNPHVISYFHCSIGYINSRLEEYTALKNLIPKLKSKEYYIVNQTEFIFKQYGDFNEDIKCPLVITLKYHSLYLTWVKKKIAFMDSFVASINAITINQEMLFFCLPSQSGNYVSYRPINIIESYKEYVYCDTHIQYLTNGDQTNLETMRKDYTFNHFEPLMLLAKNIIDLTEEIKPEYCIL